jgi:hypothetical protein
MPLVKSIGADDTTSAVLGANDSGVVGVAVNVFVVFSVAGAVPEDSGRLMILSAASIDGAIEGGDTNRISADGEADAASLSSSRDEKR